MEIKITLNLNYLVNKLKNKIEKFKTNRQNNLLIKQTAIWKFALEKFTGATSPAPVLMAVQFKRTAIPFRYKVVKNNKVIGYVNTLMNTAKIKSDLTIANLLLSTRAVSIDKATGMLVVYNDLSLRYITIIEVAISRDESELIIKTPLSTITYSFKHLTDYLPFIAYTIVKFTREKG